MIKNLFLIVLATLLCVGIVFAGYTAPSNDAVHLNLSGGLHFSYDSGVVNLTIGDRELGELVVHVQIPNVTDLTPVNNSVHIYDSVLLLGANITHNSSLRLTTDSINVSITLNNGTVQHLNLTNASQFWRANYSIPQHVGNFTVTFFVEDTGGNTNNTENIVFHTVVPPLSFTLLGNQILEMGTNIDFNVTGTGSEFCVDIEHPSYGMNFSCGNDTLPIDFNITFFRRSELNDSNTSLNFTYNITPANFTVHLTSHQFDIVDNFTINLTGYTNNGTFPTGVKIYINGSLSNSLGGIGNASGQGINLFDNGNSSLNVSFTTVSTKFAEFIRVPKNANVTGASLTVTGFISPIYRVVDVPGFVHEGFNMAEPGEVTSATIEQLFAPNVTMFAVEFPEAIVSDEQDVKLRRQDGIVIEEMDAAHEVNNTLWIFNTPRNIDDFGGTVFKMLIDCGTCHEASNFNRSGTNNRFWGSKPEISGLNIRDVETFTFDIFMRGHSNFTYIEVGDIDGVREFFHNGSGTTAEFVNSTNRTGDFAAEMNSFLVGCTADSDGFCRVPVHVFSQDPASITLGGLSVNYTVNLNPIELLINLTQAFLDAQDNATVIPITFESTSPGILELSGIAFDYAGGNQTINMTAHNLNTSETNLLNFSVYFSDWDFTFPRFIDFLEFIPQRPNQSNVTPFGQTHNVSMFNFTAYNYGDLSMNFSVLINHSVDNSECVSLFMGNDNDSALAVPLINNTWVSLLTGINYATKWRSWMFANYSCNFTTWKQFQPEMHFRACATGSECGEELQ